MSRLIEIEKERVQDSIYAEKLNKNPLLLLDRLGWVNCDRLTKQDKVMQLSVLLPRSDNYNVKVILKKTNQIIGPTELGNNLSKFQIGSNENVVVVGLVWTNLQTMTHLNLLCTHLITHLTHHLSLNACKMHFFTYFCRKFPKILRGPIFSKGNKK